MRLTTRRIAQMLYAVAAAGFFLGLWLFATLASADGAIETSADVSHGREREDVAPRAVDRQQPLTSFGVIADSNIFSASRRAPRIRFALRGPEPAPVQPVTTAPPPPTIRVYGITLRATDSTALIDADPRIPGAEVYRVGDLLPDGSVIVTMTENEVVVSGTRGRRVLRLETRGRR